MYFEGVLRATASKLQDFLSFKKSVPEKYIGKIFYFLVKISPPFLPTAIVSSK
jgi:hypothetical protein